MGRQRRLEEARSKRLVAEADAWERSAQIRRYISALRERVTTLDSPERERVLEWCEWAADWAERSDPVRFTEQALADAPPQLKRQTFQAFDLRILYDKAERRVEVSATVSEAVAEAFENEKALLSEGSLVVARDIAGARFVSRYHPRIVERMERTRG